MRLKIIIVAFALALASGAGYADTLAPFELHKSPGGVAFWYRARPDLPKNTLVAGWRDGVGYSIPGKQGLSEVGVRMLTRLASNHALDNIYEALRDLGADGRITTNGWQTYAMLTGSPRNFDAAATLADKIFTAPAPDQNDLDKIEADLAAVISAGEKQPAAFSDWAADRLGEPERPENALRNDPAAYRAITREDVDMWRKRVFARDNLALAVEGPTSAEDFGAIFDKLLGSLPEKSDAVAQPDQPFAARPQTIVIESPQPQTTITSYAPTNIGLSPERLRHIVAIQALGGGGDSRLTQTIRKEMGASYGVYARLTIDRDHELVIFGGAVANEMAPEALAAMNRVFADWRDNGVTAAEVSALAGRWKAALEDYFRRPGDGPNEVVIYSLYDKPPTMSFDYPERLSRYAAEDVSAAVRAEIPAPPFLTIVVAPSAAPFHADCVIKNWREVDKCR